MTLRGRLILLVALGVSVAVTAAAVATWLLTGGAMLREVDDRLVSQSRLTARVVVQVQEGQRPSARLLSSLQPVSIGVELIAPDGTAVSPAVGTRMSLPPDDVLQSLLAGERTEAVRTVRTDQGSWRVASRRLGDGSVLQVARSLAGHERTLDQLAYRLLAVCLLGVVASSVIGWVVVRAGLRPVDRVTAAAEHVARSKDLAARIQVRGRDEVARLGESVNAMLVALDDTRRKQQALVDDAAHELRTPLTVLRSDLDLLLASDAGHSLPAAERRALLSDLSDTARELSELVTEIIDLSRGDEPDEELGEVDVEDLVLEAVARERRSNRDVAVTLSGQCPVAAVPGHSVQRAVANLVRNAVAASPPGSAVDVSVSGVDRMLEIAVADRGPGVPEEERTRMFDRFYRGDGSRSKEGSGLGLAIVRQAASRCGGGVRYEPRQGGGSVFVLSLPLTSRAEGTRPPPA